jgi:hypothetical protein
MSQETNKLPTIKIQGKEYVEVKTRILELHRQNDSFSMTTEILSDDDTKVVMQTRLKIDNRIFTGIASENKDQSSPYENCETSSVGRCLGFYGIGIVDSVESSDGMTKYHNNAAGSNPKPKIEVNDDYIPFKNGKNKGNRIADIDVGSLEWIVHESGMAQEVKDYANRVLGEKYKNEDNEEETKITAEPKEDGDLSDSEELPF